MRITGVGLDVAEPTLVSPTLPADRHRLLSDISRCLQHLVMVANSDPHMNKTPADRIALGMMNRSFRVIAEGLRLLGYEEDEDTKP